jgi:hypothetical protein
LVSILTNYGKRFDGTVCQGCPVKPVVKSTLCASDCHHGAFCQNRPIHSILCASSILNATQKQLGSLCYSDILH